ncbi:MAG TPA: hypothetical protein VIF64_21460 [Pyrinomonadaceae bacterium]|jgi:hypothetical protein
MRKVISAFALFASAVFIVFFGGDTQKSSSIAAQSADKLVYADFDTMKDNRPVSTRGGRMQIFGGSENPGVPAKFTGMPGANDAPELVRIKPDDPNKAATFSYAFSSPNSYASVTLDIHGLPDQDGKPTAEDVRSYKNLTVQIYAKGTPSPTGVQYMRVELTSHRQGINLPYGFPQMSFKLGATGFNTYKIPLKSLAQPSWMEDKVDTKEVLKKLTSVQISVYCNQCTPINGMVVIDNVVFTN